MRWAKIVVCAGLALAGAGCIWSGNLLTVNPGKPCAS